MKDNKQNPAATAVIEELVTRGFFKRHEDGHLELLAKCKEEPEEFDQLLQEMTIRLRQRRPSASALLGSSESEAALLRSKLFHGSSKLLS